MRLSLGALVAVFAVAGCGAPPVDHTPPPPPPRIEVIGRVIDPFSWAVEGATVLIAGQPPVVTDERGRFSIADVTPPYALTVIDRDVEGHPLVLVDERLTRADPTIVALPRHLERGSIAGRISSPGRGPSQGAVAYGGPEATSVSVAIASDGSFAFTGAQAIAWRGPGDSAGTLHALQWQTADSGRRAYLYGQKDDVRLAPGEALGGQELGLRPVGVNELHLRIAPGPFSVTDLTLTLYVSFDSDALLPVVDSSAQVEGRYAVPDIPGAACLAVVRAQSAPGVTVQRQFGNCGGEWSFTLDTEAPAPVFPADLYSGVSSETEFRWSGTLPLYEVDLDPQNAQQPRYRLLTPEQSIKIPDLSSAGIPFPQSAVYRWRIRSDYKWGTTIDELASETGALIALEEFTGQPIVERFAPPGVPFTYLESAPRQFTSAP